MVIYCSGKYCQLQMPTITVSAINLGRRIEISR
jgi:hypothetical protein